MTTEHVRRILRKQPFEPFTIHMSDGRSLAVTHADFVALPPENLSSTFIVWDKDGNFELLSIRQVTGLTSKGEPPPMPERRRRKDDEQ